MSLRVMTYSINGNLLDDGSATYLYDRANRLISTTLSSATSLFNYNGDGARLKQTVAGVVTTYTQDLAAPLPVVLQSKTGVTTTKYLYATGTRPLAQNTAGWEYLLTDALDSVRQIINANGYINRTQDYEPYGSLMNSSGSDTSVYGFTGEERDQSGLIYLRARYVQPRLGIFLARDPWSGDVLRPGSMNGFSYAGGNPIIIIDSSGKCYPPLQFLRDWEPQNCQNLDLALLILGDPRSTPVQKLAPGFYVGLWTSSHAAVVAGAGILAYGGVVYWGQQYLANHPETAQKVTDCADRVISVVEDRFKAIFERFGNRAGPTQYAGFTSEENTYIQQALSNPANGQLTCHSASLCGLDVLSPLNMVPDSTGALMQDTSFKLVGEYPPNALANQLKPGDLLTYYAPGFVEGIEDLSLPVHSNRVLQILDGIVYTFDKLGPRLDFAELPLSEVLTGIPGLIKVLVYRK